jgi:hypothetical protein
VPPGRKELDGWPQYRGRLRLDNMGRCQVGPGGGLLGARAGGGVLFCCADQVDLAFVMRGGQDTCSAGQGRHSDGAVRSYASTLGMTAGHMQCRTASCCLG